MSTFRLRWRFFWSRRSRRRKSLALLLMLVSLVAITYVAIPATWRLRAQDGLLAVGQGIRSVGLTTALIAGVALCLVVSLLLLFIPSYRRHSYLASSPSIIPPVSVYLDAENQLLAETAIRPFFLQLMKRLNGRRADLLYFLDASLTSTTERYRALYRFGFRPVDVPHNLFGTGRAKEVVDKELAMHAYERALAGPPNQEFIIVSTDKDYINLVYRLVALGHHVQIWAASISPAYHALKSYLDIDLIELDPTTPRQKPTAAAGDAPTTMMSAFTSVSSATGHNRKSKHGSRAKIVNVPEQVTKAAEQRLLGVITQTLSIRAVCENSEVPATDQRDHFRRIVAERLSRDLADLGYPASRKVDYWIEHLATLRVLSESAEQLPALGPTPPENAARALLRIAKITAWQAIVVAGNSSDGRVTTVSVANGLKANVVPKMQGETATIRALLRLATSKNAKRSTHARCFVRSARALGFLDFDEVQGEPDTLLHPRALMYRPDDSGVDDSQTATEPHAASERKLEAGKSDTPQPDPDSPSGDISASP